MGEALAKLRAYLWRGHDGESIAAWGHGARYLALAGSVVFLTLCAVAFPVRTGNEPQFLTSPLAENAPHPLIGEYCMGCHDSIERTANLAFDEMSLDDIGNHAGDWEAVLRRLNSGLMPPAGAARPSAREAAALIQDISLALDAQGLPPEPTVLRRLTRTEYANVIRDLLGVSVDVTTLLPPDPSSRGFDNIGENLTSSPALVEGYLKAGMRISRLAVGDPTMNSSRNVVTAATDLGNRDHVDGTPLGTRGGLRFDALFPVEADYEIEVRSGTGTTLFQRFGSGTMPAVDLTVAGKHFELDDEGRARLHVKAGEFPVTASLRDLDVGPGVNEVYSTYAVKGSIVEVAINGPFNAKGAGDTVSRRKIFICQPKSAAEERPCAQRIVANLASKAFRRPLDREGSELREVMAYYDAGRREGNFEAGIERALAYVLVDPRFLYRIEYEPAGTAPGVAYEVTPVELASRLSFFLWGSIPDDALMASATSGKLSDPDELSRQVDRMLADPKSMAMVDNFGGQWLHMSELAVADRQSDHFDGNLRQAMLEETREFLASVMRHNQPMTDLLDADYTYLNERLAQHYGIDGVVGDYFRRVELPADSPRRGLLGKASILTLTSVADRTSPVIRGAWVLDNILGVPPSPPPPGVEINLDADAQAPSTLRERLAEHRKDPVCASCHNMMDPIGLSLENFDNTGYWRTQDSGLPIDASSQLLDGTKINGVADLRNSLLGTEVSFVSNLTGKLMTFALGRQVGPREMPTVRRIMSETQGDDYRWGDVIQAIVASEPFRTRTKPGAATRSVPVQTTQRDRSVHHREDDA